MSTIKEDYVSFETAKLLKEKGFNIETIKYWENEGGTTTIPSICELSEPYSNSYLGTHEYSCPSQSMAMKWLREKYNIIISIVPKRDKYYFNPWQLWDSEWVHTKAMLPLYNSYEEACEGGIKYCLENLI